MPPVGKGCSARSVQAIIDPVLAFLHLELGGTDDTNNRYAPGSMSPADIAAVLARLHLALQREVPQHSDEHTPSA